MQTATAAYGTIVTGNDVTYAIRVTITWPAAVPAAYQTLSELVVESCRPVRETQTDMPDATRYVTGKAGATCDITLSGLLDKTDATKTITWLMGQYQATSPMFRTSALGLPVTVDMGVLTADPTMTTTGYEGVEFVRVFTGVIDDYTVDHAAGEVALTCLDGRNKLRNAVTLPAGVVDFNPYTQTRPGLTGLYPMDYLLRSGGIHSGPPSRTGCVGYVSGHGSAWPEIAGPITTNAIYGASPSVAPVWTVGKWAPQVPTACTILVPTLRTVPFNTGSVLVFEGWVKTRAVAELVGTAELDGPLGSTADSIIANLWSDSSGNPYVQVTATRSSTTTSTGTSATGSGGPGWHQYTIVLTINASTITVQTWLDGTSVANLTLTGLIAWTRDLTLLNLFAAQPMDTWQWTSGEVSPTPVTGFTPTAVLDPSLNYLTTLADVTGQDDWQVWQDLAEAEMGIAGFDETGLFVFRNRTSIQSAASVRTIDAAVSLQSLSLESAQAALRNHIQVPVSKVQIGAPTWVWSASDTLAVPANGVLTQIITTDHPVTGLATTDSGRMAASQTANGNTYWRACTTADGTGAEITAGIAITCAQIAPTVLKLTVKSTHSATAYLVTPTASGYPSASVGQPCLVIGGQFATPEAAAGDVGTQAGAGVMAESQYPPLVPDGGAAASPQGDNLLILPINPWRQQLAVAQQLSDDLLFDLSSSRPSWNNVTIVADPRLQRGDRVTLTDPDGSGINGEDAIIAALEISEDWTMVLDLRAVAAPGGWLLGVAGRSELNQTIYVT